MNIFRRVAAFYGLTFVFTIILAIVQQFSGLDGEKIILPQFGPGVAAVVMIVWFRSDNLKIRIAPKRASFSKYIVAFGLPMLVSTLLFLIYSQFIQSLTISFPNAVSLTLMVGGMLLGAFGEELGWRSYLQNLLDKRLNGLAAFLLVGILWGLWHVGNYQNGVLYMLFFTLATIGYSATMAWLFRDDDYNVILAGLFHFAVSLGFFMLKDALADLRLMALNGLVWFGIAVFILLFRKEDFLRTA
jgi:membrane protease YdiL (CAAX protease family)